MILKDEKHTRSIIKTISWRILATFATMAIVYLFTGEVVLMIGVGVVEVISKMILYYFHERAWTHIKWGKPVHHLSDINIDREVRQQDKLAVKNKLKELGYISD